MNWTLCNGLQKTICPIGAKSTGVTVPRALFVEPLIIAVQREKLVRSAAATAGFSSFAATAAAAPIRLLEAAIKLSGREYHRQ